MTSKLHRAFDTIDAWLEKGGKEGSRGGKVIGHTKSGKPIYDRFGHASHSGFSMRDHEDADLAHQREETGAFHDYGADHPAVAHHSKHSKLHQDAAEKKK